MNSNIAIKFENVCKSYKLYKKYNTNVLTSIFFNKEVKEKQVLKDVSFEIKQGESVSIIRKKWYGKIYYFKINSRNNISILW